MDKVSAVSQPTGAGKSDPGLENLSRVKPEVRTAMRVRGEARTGAATQGGDGYRAPPTVSPLPKVKGSTPASNPLIEPDRKIDPYTPSRVKTLGQKTIEQTASAVMARADPTTELLNSAVKRFYQEASGGAAARSNRNMSGPLREVAELKSQLASLISSSASFVGANNAAYPALGKWRQDLIKSLGAIDTWLKGANAYAAGLTPGGEKTATPALVRPPSVVLTSSVSPRSASQEATEIGQQYRLANAVITRR